MDPFYIAIMLYVAALTLAVMDIFLPSGGMLLILATAAAVASILFGFRSGSTMGMIMLTTVAASVPAFAFAAIKIWPLTPIGRRVILRPPSQTPQQSSTQAGGSHSLIGKVLVADSALLPSGQLKFGHRRLNAVAENGLIEAGQRVKVIAVRDRNLIVRSTDEPLSQVDLEQSTTAAKEREVESEASLLDRPADELGLDSLED